MPYSCWTTATSKVFNAAAAARCELAERTCRCPATSGATEVTGPFITRTMPAVSPVPGTDKPRIKDRENVARPHWVGGYVLRKPNDRGTRPPSTGHRPGQREPES